MYLSFSLFSPPSYISSSFTLTSVEGLSSLTSLSLRRCIQQIKRKTRELTSMSNPQSLASQPSLFFKASFKIDYFDLGGGIFV